MTLKTKLGDANASKKQAAADAALIKEQISAHKASAPKRRRALSQKNVTTIDLCSDDEDEEVASGPTDLRPASPIRFAEGSSSDVIYPSAPLNAPALSLTSSEAEAFGFTNVEYYEQPPQSQAPSWEYHMAGPSSFSQTIPNIHDTFVPAPLPNIPTSAHQPSGEAFNNFGGVNNLQYYGGYHYSYTQ